MELAELRPGGHTQLGIQVRERLIHQKDGRFADDGTPQRHALPLAARERLGLAIQQVLDAQNARGLVHPRVDLSLGRLAQL